MMTGSTWKAKTTPAFSPCGSTGPKRKLMPALEVLMTAWTPWLTAPRACCPQDQ